ncbi:MAG: GNAT family N-acetyltransferase [Candidatus Tumulicola sp.]
MHDLLNLVVDLDERFAFSPEAAHALRTSIPGVEIGSPAPADETMLAWIDEQFGGSWSSEARAGTNVVAFCEGSPVGFATYDPKALRFRWLRGLASERDVGIFGPLGVAPERRGSGLGRTLLRLALAGLRERGYGRAAIAAANDGLVPYYAGAVGARVAERYQRVALAAPRPRTIVLASGAGSNFQAVVNGVRDGRLPIDVVGVVSNHSRAAVIERARAAEVDWIAVLPWLRKEEARCAYDARLLDCVSARKPDLVLLLGWMHLLDEPFVRTFPNLINVHPAFLPLDSERDDTGLPDGTRMPAFRGPFAVRDALAAQSRWIGATVHFVTPATDRGPVLVRKPLRVEPDEDEAHVMERLHPVEHSLVSSGIMRWLYERE